MKEFIFKIQDKNGLHARPAGLLAASAKSFSSQILVECAGKEADAKRLLSLMALGATTGKELRFKITGDDEERAYDAIKSICYEKLG